MPKFALFNSFLCVMFLTQPLLASQTANPEDIPVPVAPTLTSSTPAVPLKFDDLDRNRDGFLELAEIPEADRATHSSMMSSADTSGDGRVSRTEFAVFHAPSTLGSKQTYAALLLVVGFGFFCVFVDGLLEPERREYFWVLIIASLALPALAYLIQAEWFFDAPPYLVWLAVVPALCVVFAILTGNTKEIEHEVVQADQQKVYVVGGGGTSTARPVAPEPAPRKKVAGKPAAKRGSMAPGRTARRQAPRPTSPPPPQQRPGQRPRRPRPPESGGGSTPRPPKKDS